jgi:hypothetical protein
MNTIAKVGVASALAMGYVSAQASVVVPGNSSATTDIVLFAEVVSGYTTQGTGTVVASYAGDTQIAVGGTIPTGSLIATSSDAALNSLITIGQSAGNTIEWAVEGGKFAQVGVNLPGDQYLTTLTSGSLGTRTAGNTAQWSTGLQNTLSTVNVNAAGANSVYATTTAKGGVFDVTTLATNVSNLFTNGAFTNITGLTSTTLYNVAVGSSAITTTSGGTLTLSTAGLSFAPSAVPLPAAIWLLGGGLLGLAGVSRRKPVVPA